MNSRNDQDPLAETLSQAIRDLPQAAAGPGFRAAVLARAAAATARRRSRRRRGLGMATVFGLIACGLGLWNFDAARDRASRRAALVDEHRRLLGELEELRELASRRSLVPLGGDSSTDLYLDLATVPAAAAGAPPSTQTRSQI